MINNSGSEEASATESLLEGLQDSDEGSYVAVKGGGIQALLNSLPIVHGHYDDRPRVGGTSKKPR